MSKDVEMADGEEAKTIDNTSNAQAEASVSGVLDSCVLVIERAVRTKDIRTAFNRVLRQVTSIRRRMTPSDVRAFIVRHLSPSSEALPALEVALDQAEGARMGDRDPDVVEPGSKGAGPPSPEPLALIQPEVEALASVLTTTLLVDCKCWEGAYVAAAAGFDAAGARNRRSLDALGARLASLLCLAAPRCGRGGAALRARLLAAHQAACLRRDELGAETLLNCLLGGLLDEGRAGEAHALQARAPRADRSRSAAQATRWLYYLGRVHAVRLEYTAARDCLAAAARKAPRAARGFRAAVARWLAVTRLLLGEALGADELARGDLAPRLAPVLAVTQAVRSGDLAAFESALAAHANSLRADRLYVVALRLRGAVIRAGLRAVATAYSRIALADVATKLGLPSAGDAEAVVAKAIRDGSIDARLDHAAGTMEAAPSRDAYAGVEPAAAFHARIAFCMDVHNEALRAMRYESLAGAELEDADKLKERQEMELQAALDDDGMGF